MMILVSGATATMSRYIDDRLGVLHVPKAGNAPSSARRWAADNGAFSGFDATAFLDMLERLRGVQNCLFVAAPDVVGNAAETLRLFPQWSTVVRSYGFPVAFVAQDGLTVSAAPWADFDALFIGGTTEFKLGAMARTLAGYAQARGKWVHMGRVNSRRRLRYASRIGCDSIDGTCFSKWPDIFIPKGLAWMDRINRQPEFAF